MVYDKADRLILSQDGNQRAKISTSQWTVTKYDVFGRVLYTGTMPGDTNKDYATLLKNIVITEAYNGSGNTGYSEQNYGVFTTIAPLTVNYYDDYVFLPSSNPLLYQEKQGYSKQYTVNNTPNAKGLLTGTRTYLLDGSGAYTASAMYYDDKGRVVQTRSTNHLGGYDIVYSDLDFTGKPNKTLKEHNIAGQAVIPELYTYSYDHAGRVTKTEYQFNEQAPVILADMTASGSYDELGRLKNKKRHNGADTEQFDYNIRNWLTKITSGEFEENLYYNTTPSNSIQTYPCYNGNISYCSWTYNGGTRGYQYNYDGLNRYIGGYAFINNVMQVDYQYSESFNYNKMGNITSLTRYSGDDVMDQLDLQYTGNQLKYVNDNGIQQSIYGLKDYQNKSTATSDEFAYDSNGNMTKDLDRDIYTIRYNLLNLPDTIQFKNGHQIINKYDASGKKLSTRYYTVLVTAQVPLVSTLTPGKTIKLQYDMDIIDETGTFYVDNFEYGFNGCDPGWYWVERIYNPEGYFKDRGDFGDMGFNYFRRDHLGNNREVWHPQYSFNNISYTEKTIQRTQYYPSGLPWAESTGAIVQNKKYNGKEWIEMHGLDVTDLGNRGLHHAKGRFDTMDRFCEKYPWQSPYVFAGNNPVNYVDVNGDSINISGPEQQMALQQAQARVSSELTLTRQNNGTITAVQITTGTLSNDAQQLMDATNSGTISININTIKGDKDANGNLIVGGGFGGNTVTKTPNGNTVDATQTINPKVLGIMSNAHGVPGQDVLHEIAEAYQGALISQKTGVSSPASNQSGSVYAQAHAAATPQSGVITQTAFSTIGMPMSTLSNGTYLYPIGKVEWSVVNTAGNKIIIQTLRP